MVLSVHILAGLVCGAVLVGAILFSRLFRGLALALCASAVCMIYVYGGVPKILAVARSFQYDAAHAPSFFWAAAIAGASVMFIALILRAATKIPPA